MSKEAVGQKQQTEMQKTMLELEAKNSAMGGRLFATFGRGNSRALIFPTSAIKMLVPSEKVSLKPFFIEDFLMVTHYGNKVIHVDGLYGLGDDNLSADYIARIVENRQEQKQKSFFHIGSGYRYNEVKLDGKLNINGSEATIPSSLISHARHYTNCRLMDASGSQVEGILRLNINRVEAERATSQMVSGVLGKAG